MGIRKHLLHPKCLMLITMQKHYSITNSMWIANYLRENVTVQEVRTWHEMEELHLQRVKNLKKEPLSICAKFQGNCSMWRENDSGSLLLSVVRWPGYNKLLADTTKTCCATPPSTNYTLKFRRRSSHESWLRKSWRHKSLDKYVFGSSCSHWGSWPSSWCEP